MLLNNTAPVVLGKSKSGSKKLYANTPLNIIYKNNSQQRKELQIQFEYGW